MDIERIWRRKGFGLNGWHKGVGDLGCALGHQYVADTMKHPSVPKVMRAYHSEISKFLGGEDFVLPFSESTHSRLLHLPDDNIRVCEPGTRKTWQRHLDAVQQFVLVTGRAPRAITFLTAVWLLNTYGNDINGCPILHGTVGACLDPFVEKNGMQPLKPAFDLTMEWIASSQSPTSPTEVDKCAVAAILAEIARVTEYDRFRELSDVDSFCKEFGYCLLHICSLGIEAAMVKLFESDFCSNSDG